MEYPRDSKPLTARVVVASDSVSQGLAKDSSGELLAQKMALLGIACEPLVVVPDEKAAIAEAIMRPGTDIVVVTGGTGIGPRDVTPEAVVPLLDKRLPGVEEAIRAYGMAKTPLAMLSRTVAGMRGECLILCLPGSPSGVRDAIEAVFPHVLHVFDVREGKPHKG